MQEMKIQNITLEDEGKYVCEVLAPSGHTKRKTYTLNIFSKLKLKRYSTYIYNKYFVLYCFFSIFR